MTHPRRRTAVLLGLATMAIIATAFYLWITGTALEPAIPHVDAVWPLGVRRGYATELTIHGSGLLGNPSLVAPFRIAAVESTPGASDRNRWSIRLTVEADAALGVYPVRVLTDQGLSNPFPLAVGQLPQILAKADNENDNAQRVVLPVVIDGKLAGNSNSRVAGSHYFRFHGQKGQRIVCGFLDNQIGSKHDLWKTLVRKLADEGEPSVLDPSATILNDGEYQLGPIGAEGGAKNGHSAYRLTVGSLPWAEHIYPLGGRRGESIAIELRGGTLAGTKMVTIPLLPAPDEDFVRTRVVSDSLGPDGKPLDFELLPALEIGDLPEFHEPATSDGRPQRATPPVVLNGRMELPWRDIQYILSVMPGQRIRAVIKTAYFKTYDRPRIKVFGAHDKELPLSSERKVLDWDGVPRHVAVDPVTEFTVPAGENEVTLKLFKKDEVYTAEPQLDREKLSYRITVVPVVPGFELSLEEAQITVPRGGTSAVGVRVNRHDFTGAITLRLIDAPPGLSFRAGAIAEGQTIGAFSITADAHAAFTPIVLAVVGEGRGPAGQIVAKATKLVFFGDPTTEPYRFTADVVDGKPVYVDVPARLRTRIQSQPGIFVATARAAPVAFDADPGPLNVERGSSFEFKVNAVRRNIASGTITISPLPLPSGLSIPQVSLGPTENEATINVKVANDFPLGEVSIVLLARGGFRGVEHTSAVPAVTLRVVESR